MSQAEAWTVGRLLKWTADYLRGHGSDSPRLDAEVLLAESLQCQRIDLYTRFDELPPQQARHAFRELVRRRGQGAPVAYLVGHREFYSLSFRVTPDVLIPRPETELLVVAALDLAKQHATDAQITICDIGTGSGIIAVCLAKYLPNCRVTAVDISPAALVIARQNATAHGVEDRIEFLQSDLFAAIPADRRFDLIASNPPYVSQAEIETLAPDVKQFEPREALVAGRHGTEVIQALLPQAAEHLKPGGHLLIEISPMVHDKVASLIEADPRFHRGQTTQDLARLPRIVQAQRRADE